MQHNMMEKSSAVIVLALEKYAQYIDHDIENYNRDLNNVMKVFTLIAVTFLPQTVIGSLFGMNVIVPMMNIDNLYPFWAIVSVTGFFSLMAIVYFRHLKYI